MRNSETSNIGQRILTLDSPLLSKPSYRVPEPEGKLQKRWFFPVYNGKAEKITRKIKKTSQANVETLRLNFY